MVHSSWRALIVLGFVSGAGIVPANADWNPSKQYAYTKQQCASARTALQKDECQCNSESLTEGLRRCIKERSVYARQCEQMLPSAQEFLRNVNRDPVLLNHRNQQWNAQRQNQQEQIRKGPSGIMPTPNPNRNCAPLPNGQWSCYW